VDNTPKYITSITGKAWATAYHSHSTTLKQLRAMIGASGTFYQWLIRCKFTLITDYLLLKNILEAPSLQG
jgi:hypothetical protein